MRLPAPRLSYMLRASSAYLSNTRVHAFSIRVVYVHVHIPAHRNFRAHVLTHTRTARTHTCTHARPLSHARALSMAVSARSPSWRTNFECAQSAVATCTTGASDKPCPTPRCRKDWKRTGIHSASKVEKL